MRRERPHPGAKLRITDTDGLRLTCFATNTADVPIAALEPRHRPRARAENRIRAARTTGLRNSSPLLRKPRVEGGRRDAGTLAGQKHIASHVHAEQ